MIQDLKENTKTVYVKTIFISAFNRNLLHYTVVATNVTVSSSEFHAMTYQQFY